MTFLLAHLSDAHIGPIPRPNLAELLGKRVTGYVNWLYKRADQHDMAVLGRIVADMKAHAPDHVLMTGDIVNIGLPAEIALARDWLASLGPTEAVSFTPGNHDAYVEDATPIIADAFAPWMASEPPGGSGRGGFPSLRRRGGLALIGLDSGVPTAPFVASGELGAAQRGVFAELLETTGREGLTRVVFLHHPPHVGGARILRGLEDAAEFETIIARHGAELIVHGHNHRPSLAWLSGPAGETPVVGVASASARPGGHRPSAAYHLFAFEGNGAAAKITLRARGVDDFGGIVETAPVVLTRVSRPAA